MILSPPTLSKTVINLPQNLRTGKQLSINSEKIQDSIFSLLKFYFAW